MKKGVWPQVFDLSLETLNYFSYPSDEVFEAWWGLTSTIKLMLCSLHPSHFIRPKSQASEFEAFALDGQPISNDSADICERMVQLD